MTHYICKGGCEGVAIAEGQCQAPTCPHFNHDLLVCECQEQEHLSKLETQNPTENNESV